MSDVRTDRKQMICDLLRDELYVPMKARELAQLLQVSREDREEFKRILDELVLEGQIIVTPRGKYKTADGSVLIGTYVSNSKGFGFVEIEGREDDLFIPKGKEGGAFHNDKVQIVLIPTHGGRRQEAQVVRIIERGVTQVVGFYEQNKEHYGFVIPDDGKIGKDIFIAKEHTHGAVHGHKVVAKILDYGGEHRSPEGEIVEILGHANDPGVDILSIVRGYDLPTEFSEKVLNQATRVAKDVSAADCAGRRDLRGVTMVTIDGEDAKDLDDAVSVSFDGTYYHLGVHIADVSNYVQENSALDHEALDRGTSVYLVDRVIPMLPHTLSNGICSLNQGVDRLALSCLMTIDGKGEIVDHELCESVIRVDKRMSYTAVAALLADPALVERDAAYAEYAGLVQDFLLMNELAGKLRARRKKRGSIDFDFPECKIMLDEQGHPLAIAPYERTDANLLIEDFMLAANETVAQHFYWEELPFVYRVHDVPDGEKLTRLSAFINNYGYTMKAVGRRKSKVDASEVHPKEIQRLLAKIAGTPEEPMIARLTLRSMKQAKYSTVCSGHFGLACSYYCHFTSPIRRYPDLQIHRIIKDELRGRLNADRIEHYREILDEVAKQSSAMERRADEAERETEKLKKVEYMQDHIGEEYDGVVSSVTGWGLYVELSNTVEGLVHISKLTGDYYVYHENTGELVGEATGHTYRLGTPVRVRVEDCDHIARTIDFTLIDG